MILQGDSLDVLKTLPANHFQVCVTSPPYWSLRDYKVPPTVWGGNARWTQLAIAGANAKGEYRGGATKAYAGGRAENPSDLKRRILAGMRERVTVGWAPTCQCPPGGALIPCRVLDPFAGSSATGAAAVKLGRDFTGIELNPDYIDMAERRLKKAADPPKARRVKPAARVEVDEPLPFVDEVPA